MSAALLFPFDTANETLPRKKFTRQEVEHLTAEGFFEGQRYELIDGDLIDKMGQKPPHAVAIQNLLRCSIPDIWSRLYSVPVIPGRIRRRPRA